MTAIEYAIVALFLSAGFLGYCIGRVAADADRALERMHEQRRRGRLAREIEEGIAAFHSRPVGGVGEVVPFVRRENRDGVA